MIPRSLLLNKGQNGNHWISIRTVGTTSNRDGIGARIILWAGGRRQVDEVRSGGSYLSQSDLRVHFGLGDATRVEALEIHWPSGRTDRMKDLSTNQILVVEEGKGVVSGK